MKQIEINDTVRAKLKAAAGDDVDLNNLAVFRATAINTLPVRKRHPVYHNGVHQRSFLQEMNAALEQETRPLQIMHNGEVLPIGRIFSGSIVDNLDNSELQVLFWIDKTTPKGAENVNLVNNGTVDQVSVAVLPKSAISNKTGFDFLGPDATFENIWGGVDDKGNVMGKDGAHVIMSNLDSWYEMSLVGQGGITGAKIHPSGEMKLAASGSDVPRMTLLLSIDNKEDEVMDLTELVNKLTETTTALALANAAKATADAELAAKNAEIETLKTKVAEQAPAAEKLASVETENTALKGTVNTLFTHVAAISGDVTAAVPAEAEALVASFKTNVDKVKALTPGKPTLEASAGNGLHTMAASSNAAFTRRK